MSKRWYVVHVYSGMEKSVHKAMLERIERADLQHLFGQVLVPSEEVVESKGGQKSISERRIFPGYVLVEMDLTDESWHVIKNTPRVTGFLGGSGNGEMVRVKDGPFADFNGNVEEVNYEKSKVRVSVAIFGRSTPVELDFSQVEKT
jgi:transcriptional antiterminator NusG